MIVLFFGDLLILYDMKPFISDIDYKSIRLLGQGILLGLLFSG